MVNMIAQHFILVVNFYLVAMMTVNSVDEEVWSLTGVAGRTSDLPCYLSPRTPGDRPKLILWYKKGIKTPIISSYDGRLPDLHSTVHREEYTLTVGRATATLTINTVGIESAGIFECRVDFYKSPTHTSLVNLTVIVPPTNVEILDSVTGPAKNGIVGPYYEEQKINITCLARDGSPLPNVTWWRNERIVDAIWEKPGQRLVRNNLVVERLTRSWHNQTLTCTASNTHLANPVSASVVVQMYLLPTSVVIANPGPVTEGEIVELTCTSEGSRPPAVLKWIVKGIKHPAAEEQNYGGMTTSKLLITVSREDHKSTVICQAHCPNRPDRKLTNTTVLNVRYPPLVEARLGENLDPTFLNEGVDVYFTCVVDANPNATLITWYHEDKPQVQNLDRKVILAGNSLVLQKVNRRQAGQYRCEASNILATVSSPSVRLRIRYTPECDIFPTTYFIYDKPINVTCTVSSFPPVESIHWQWNNSNDVIRTEPVTAELEKSSAQLTVNPIQSREDRVLSCWAVNEMGRQTKPCGFTFKVAQMPLPLSSCRLANITASSLSLTCQRPHVTSAVTTEYRAEVYFQNNTLFANVTSNRPNFNVSKLDAGTSYQIKVYVTHGPVTSQPVVVSAYTSRTSRTSTGADPSSEKSGNSVGGVVGGVVVALVCLVGVILARNYCRKRRSRRKQDPRPPSDDSNPDVVPNIEETYDLLSSGEGKSDAIVYDVLDPSAGEDMPMQAMSDQQESYHPLMLQHSQKDTEEYPGVRTDLYCPVDQMMKAEESVV